MDQFTKEGRKLRPRKTAYSAVGAEKVNYRSSEESPRQNSEHRQWGEKKSYGERRSYGENRSYGEQRRPYGEDRRQAGEGRPSRGPRQNSRPGFKSGRPGSTFGNGARKKVAGKGPKRPGQGSFNKDSYEGIKRMINRRPVVNGSESEDVFVPEIKDVVRLNRFIANSGVCSRREADTLIQAGVVTVNGEVVTELGTKVNIHDDDIRFNGERLKGEEKVYLIMNKPKGYVTTASDPHAEKTVIDLLKGCSSRVYPVGRLDKNTTGVLLLTNDGEIAERLTHPSYDKKKIYQVSLDKELSEEDYHKILEGVSLTDGDVKADELEFIDANDKRKIGIEIHSGKNRIVRRIFDSLGYNVKALDRVYFAGLTKKGLKKGEWRYLTEGEINILKIGAYV
ncbi:MAG: pseudouridine synthase [Bacteroides sp.]|nr:rRNA pseudouridine synthase [Bacteroides sp.]MDD7490918.1 pseudouridine synthase [Bacteroides sp.]